MEDQTGKVETQKITRPQVLKCIYGPRPLDLFVDTSRAFLS